jgi:small nuclear ribonucleoprotein (snRNP)-like protein
VARKARGDRERYPVRAAAASGVECMGARGSNPPLHANLYRVLGVALNLGAFSILLRQRVIVNTKTDESFRGVLFQQKGQLIVLKNVEQLVEGRQPIPVDGSVVLERSAVSYYQVL